jgi:transposase-like protein
MSDSKEWLMTFIAVRCPHCDSAQIVKRGKTHRGTQRYLCQNTACARGSFLLDYRNRGCVPEVKQQIIDISLNASGVRDTARGLRISTDTVLSELKKKEATLKSGRTEQTNVKFHRLLAFSIKTSNQVFLGSVANHRKQASGNSQRVDFPRADFLILPPKANFATEPAAPPPDFTGYKV